jgi:ABC-2 type transport system permease protein
MSWRRLRTLLVREARASLRDRFTLSAMIIMPLATLLAFSSVLSTEVTDLRLAILDADDTTASRRLVADVTSGDTFDPVVVQSRDQIDHLLESGGASGALIVPPGFQRDLERARAGLGPPPEVQALYDGAEAVLAGNAEASLRGKVTASGAALADGGGGRGPQAIQGVAVDVSALFNPKLDGQPFMVAGVFGFVLSFMTTLITAVSIVNERLSGTFDQLQVTPATSVEILLGKLLPLGAVFALDVLLMMFAALVFFGVWPAGNALFFWAVSAFYVMLSLALGLLLSATSGTAAEAVQKTVLLSIPLIMLSGFAFPVRSMPGFIQWLVEIFPATHYIRISRGIYLRGEGPLDLAVELGVLALFALVLGSLALRSIGRQTQ